MAPVEYHEEGKLTDCTIKIGEKEYEVHRTLLCAKSGYFRRIAEKLVEKPFADLTDLIESRIFEIVLRYLYYGRTELSPDKLSQDDLIHLFKAADNLKMDSLSDDLFKIRQCRKSDFPYNVEHYEYYKQGKHTDCTIKIGEKEYRVHRTMIASCSNYFSKIVKELFKKPFLDLTGLIEGSIFEIIIRYLYIGKIELSPDKLSPDDLLHVIKAAQVLHIPKLYGKCRFYADELVSGPRGPSLSESWLEELKLYEPVAGNWW